MPSVSGVNADAQSIWDRAADSYARQERLEHRAIRRALDLLDPQADESLLDVATGTGLVLRELAARPTPPARVVGIDRSPGMLDRVGTLPAGWQTVQGDATALPFESASFAQATSSYLLHLLDEETRRAVLSELHRVVRPGGRLAVITVWSPRNVIRGVLAGLAWTSAEAFGGLMPCDPRPDLEATGWAISHAHVLHRGYPSLVVLGRRA